MPSRRDRSHSFAALEEESRAQMPPHLFACLEETAAFDCADESEPLAKSKLQMQCDGRSAIDQGLFRSSVYEHSAHWLLLEIVPPFVCLVAQTELTNYLS